jgi:ABC-type polysaccharide/polyol phosphate transport system ATPase subunit
MFRRQPGHFIYPLRDVSLQIMEGDVVGIMGNNGSGKSTLLKIIAGIYEPDSGTVDVHGTVYPLLELGGAFNGELSGRDNILLQGYMYGCSAVQTRALFQDIVAFSGIEEFIDQKVKNYSSGMNARLAFSVAAFMQSDVLILDEIFSVGDASFQEKSSKKMAELVTQHKAAIITGHNEAFLRSICTVLYRLEDGVLSPVL